MNYLIKIKEKRSGSLAYMRQLIFKGSDNLVTTLTSVLPRSRNMFIRLCGCNIVAVHLSDIAEDPSPKHVSNFLE